MIKNKYKVNFENIEFEGKEPQPNLEMTEDDIPGFENGLFLGVHLWEENV